MSSSIVTPEWDLCPFCQYLLGLRPYTILRRNELVATLVTREQRGIGHVLVMPVRHAATILDATQAERHALIDEVSFMVRAVDETFERPGVAVWQNNGVQAQQTVGHLHFHVAGTRIGGGTIFGPVQELSIDQTNAIAANFNEFLKHSS